MAARAKRSSALRTNAPTKRQSTNGEGGTPEPKLELLAVPAHLMLAAETIVSKAPKDRAELHGVLLHARDGIGRIVASDGARYFIGSFAVPKPNPSWLKGGILLGSHNLKARINMVAKVAGSASVIIAHAKDSPTLSMVDTENTMRFEVECSAVTEMWKYEDHIQVATFTDMDEEGERATRSEWEPVGFNSRHMKSTGEIAKILEGGIDKDRRNPNGMVVRVYQGNPDAPRIFCFDGMDGAFLIVGALQLPMRPLPLLTAKILEPASKGTLAALRAHASRWRDAAAAAETEEQRTACLAKAESFNMRVAALLAVAPERVAIAGPAAAEQPEAAGPEAVTPAERAVVTRRKRAANRAATVLH